MTVCSEGAPSSRSAVILALTTRVSPSVSTLRISGVFPADGHAAGPNLVTLRLPERKARTGAVGPTGVGALIGVRGGDGISGDRERWRVFQRVVLDQDRGLIGIGPRGFCIRSRSRSIRGNERVRGSSRGGKILGSEAGAKDSTIDTATRPESVADATLHDAIGRGEQLVPVRHVEDAVEERAQPDEIAHGRDLGLDVRGGRAEFPSAQAQQGLPHLVGAALGLAPAEQPLIDR